MKLSLSLLLILIIAKLSAQKINIGIFQQFETKKLFIEAPVGKYKIKADGKSIYKLKNKRSIIINQSNGQVTISSERKDFGSFSNVEIEAKRYRFDKIHNKANPRKNSELNIRLLSPKQESRIYQGNLRIYLNNKKPELVNQLAMADYIAGVVEAETGSKEVEEFYKNQAVICRTYAISNLTKHKGEVFNLCDGVHCQAYKGKSVNNMLITNAVKKTNDLVIVDEKNQPISALFSANCGGETNNSEDVWTAPLSYLKTINDEYCKDQRQAVWTKNISFTDFKDFLKEKEIQLPDTLSIDSFAFEQKHRLIYYTINNQQIKLTTLRYGLKLRSTFFSIKPNGDQLVFSGRGYGHGVGMCQEGAMNMARKGKKFDEIIRYYYKGVKIVPARNLTHKIAYNY